MSTQNNSVLFPQQQEDGTDTPATNFGYSHFLKIGTVYGQNSNITVRKMNQIVNLKELVDKKFSIYNVAKGILLHVLCVFLRSYHCTWSRFLTSEPTEVITRSQSWTRFAFAGPLFFPSHPAGRPSDTEPPLLFGSDVTEDVISFRCLLSWSWRLPCTSY